MGTVNVTLGDGKKLNLILGQQLENAVTAVVFDFSAWKTEFGSGTLGLSVQRHGDDQPYAVVPTVSGNNATWNISELDTAYKGVGEVQVTYTVGSVVKKSTVYKFTVYRSLGENGEYPSPGQTWQEEIEDELNDVKQDLAQYEDIFTGDVDESVRNWLDEHPEATTSVEDGSITEAKLYSSVKNAINDSIKIDEIPYYSEIDSYKERNYHTDCYFSTIPVLDDDGEYINFYVDYVADKNPLEQAQEFYTSITVNGNATLDIGEPVYRAGITISNGVVINSRSFSGYSNPNPMYIGIKKDRSYVDYQMNTNITPAQMLEDGCWNVFNCYFKLVSNGSITDLSNVYWNEYTVTEDDEDVWMLLGFKANKDIVIMTCDGRTNINDGLTVRECGNLMIAKGCVDVYCLDGGGSACLVVNGSKFNRNIDGNGTVVRSAHYTLNAKKPSRNVAVERSYSNTGLEKQRLIEQIIPYVNYINDMFVTKSTPNLDNIDFTGMFYAINATNAPTGVSPYGYCITICAKNADDEKNQIWIPYNTSSEIYMRKSISGVWSDWVFWHGSLLEGDVITVGDGQYAGLVYGNKIYVTFPLSGAFLDHVSSATWSASSGSGITIYQNGNLLAGTSGGAIKPTVGVVRTRRYTGLQVRFDVGTALTNDPNYVNNSVVMVEINGLTVTI